MIVSKNLLYSTFFIGFVLIELSCVRIQNPYTGIAPGIWRGKLILQDYRQMIVTKGKDEEVTRDVSDSKQQFFIPFKFSIGYNKDSSAFMTIYNGDEQLVYSDLHTGRNRKTGDDTFHIELAPYDAFLNGIFEQNKMKGFFVVRDKKNYHIPFEARYSEDFLFSKLPEKAEVDINGEWQVVFKDSTGDKFDAIGEFVQLSTDAKGTFRTETGDFGFLGGEVKGNHVRLSGFNGGHAFLFDAEVTEDSMYGKFYSGVHYSADFHGHKTRNGTLKNPDSIAQKISDMPVNFKLLNPEGQWISIYDKKYENTIKILQITGSWCPNCRDESTFLKEYLANHQDYNIQVIGLAFERHKDQNLALQRIASYKKQLDLPYEILLAGPANRDSASALFPQIDEIKAFPTMIILDSKNKIRKIHTGFDGPATSKYQSFKDEFNETIHFLKQEKE
ncbi:MAG: TlpA family protein disulfide reductase [Saprospiraceae bacterium]|nr:TlpA family protein disulfide reductase [Saprospiraceae bacterium]MBK7797208.1 TlpA family protein disulfide reductase [Saprospiraceae bacterium]MBK9377311.1 TlpA family protein disulfide reductase [Saprospiraceae bacterium]MBL0261707.1 TlpA family protein disulfide reductase [Saprospiraceae bacterium]